MTKYIRKQTEFVTCDGCCFNKKDVLQCLIQEDLPRCEEDEENEVIHYIFVEKEGD